MTTNGRNTIVDNQKLRHSIIEGAGNGIAGFSVIDIQGKKSKPRLAGSLSAPKPASRRSDIALKIGIAVILTLVLSILGTLLVVYLIRRYVK